MPRSWTDKDERQYEKIRESELDRGKSEPRASEIAARTVNKHRRERGDTSNVRTQGTGHPNKSLDERTRDELVFAYRESSLDELAILSAAFQLEVDDPEELTKRMQILGADLRSWLVPGLACAAFYLVLSLPLAELARRLERRLARDQRPHAL